MPRVTRRRALALFGTLAASVTTRASDRRDQDRESNAPTGATGGDSANSANWAVYTALLTGANQNPPVETDAYGTAVFRVRPDRTAVEYALFVFGIEEAVESHVHKGPPDLDGNVVAYLFGPVEEPVSTTGVLASGELTADDLVWPLTDVANLREQFEIANVYVNVHTTEHPSGEIRGQIRPLGVRVTGGEDWTAAVRSRAAPGADAEISP